MAGITPDGFEVKRLPEIKQDLEEGARSALGSDATLLPDSIEGQTIALFSEAYAEIWEELKLAYDAFNPVAVTGQALDNLVFLNGITRRAPEPSTVALSLTGVDNTVVPANSIVKHSTTDVEFLTIQAVEIGVGWPTGTAEVIATARRNGAIEALAGTLTIIGSPVNGWDTVINNADAKEGRLAERDAELRARRDRSLTIAGSASLTNIISEVARLAGVTHAGGSENFTDGVDAFGIPAHAFEIVVEGGVDNSIGQAIWNKKPVGIEPFGSTTVGVLDIFGGNHTISFTRPAPIRIWFRANVTFSGTIPDAAAQNLKDAILAYVGGALIPGTKLSVGDDVLNSRLYTPMNLTYRNFSINSLETSVDGVNFNANDIPIEFNEVSTWDIADMDIQVG